MSHNYRLQNSIPCLMPWIFFIVPPCSTHSVDTLLPTMQAPLPRRLDVAFLLTLRTLHSQILMSPVPAEWTGRPVAEYLVEEKERRQRAIEELEKSIKLVEVWPNVFLPLGGCGVEDLLTVEVFCSKATNGATQIWSQEQFETLSTSPLHRRYSQEEECCQRLKR